MKPSIKLIFYILASLVLGIVTIYEITAARNALVSPGDTQPGIELDQVKTVIGKWQERKQFEFVSTPSATIEPSSEPSEASPSGLQQ